MIIVATAAGIYFYLKKDDFYYSFVIIWALIGIIIKRVFIAEELVLSVVIAAILGIISIVGMIVDNKR